MSNEQTSVLDAIQVFLDRKAQNSENTRATYERAIRNFFLEMRGKTLEELTAEDLVFSHQAVEGYQTELLKKFKRGTVNNRIAALKSCYKKLESYGFAVRASWFDLDKNEEWDKEPSDPMKHEEIVQAIKLVLDTREGKQKALLIRLAYATAFRKESILQIKKTDLIERNGIWFVKVLGKGNKWDYKKISSDLRTELEERIAESKNDKVFTLTPKTVNRMMNYIRENIDFGDRKITFHSLKKSSIEEVALITNNDLNAMQTHGSHRSVLTTLNDYTAKKKLDDLIVVDIHYKVPVEEFDNLSHEQLLELVKSADRNVQVKLLQKLGVI
jgi:integrase